MPAYTHCVKCGAPIEDSYVHECPVDQLRSMMGGKVEGIDEDEPDEDATYKRFRVKGRFFGRMPRVISVDVKIPTSEHDIEMAAFAAFQDLGLARSLRSLSIL